MAEAYKKPTASNPAPAAPLASETMTSSSAAPPAGPTSSPSIMKQPLARAASNSTDLMGDMNKVTEEQLVENRVNKLLSKDSVGRQITESRGKQYANRRGLLDSSIGSEAAVRAQYDYATPIATQDANTITAQKFKRQDQAHEGSLQANSLAANANLQRDLQDNQLKFQTEQGDLTRSFQERMQQLQYDQNEIERQFQGGENDKQMRLERERIQQNMATELMRQVAGQNATLMDAIGQINASDISPADKTSMINRMTAIHFNNLNTTTALADFDIVNGKVVYSGSEAGNPKGLLSAPV